LLVATLAVTPLRKLLGFRPDPLPRMVGLFAFFYGCLHFLTICGSTSCSTSTKSGRMSPSALHHRGFTA